MNCPTCSAYSRVLHTRDGDTVAIKRRRECANGHRFTTVEAVPRAFCKRDMAQAQATSKARADRWKRDQAIAASGMTATELAAKYRITEARVRQIKNKSLRHVKSDL